MKWLKAVVMGVALVFVLTAIVPNNANAYQVELPGMLYQYQLYNSFPFARDYFGSGRYQQIYDSSLFSEKGYITSILFVPEYTGTYGANMQISLAYSAVSPGYLSTDLDSNIDGLAKVVLSDPSFSTSVTAGWYHLVIDFSSPTEFLYDPDKGNLLVDIVISDQSSNMGALKFYYPSGYTYQSSRAWNSSIVGNGNDSGTFPAALLTRFEYTPVPIPSSIYLLGSGLVGLVGIRRRMKKQ